MMASFAALIKRAGRNPDIMPFRPCLAAGSHEVEAGRGRSECGVVTLRCPPGSANSMKKTLPQLDRNSSQSHTQDDEQNCDEAIKSAAAILPAKQLRPSPGND